MKRFWLLCTSYRIYSNCDYFFIVFL